MSAAQIQICVLRGGPSHEHEMSLKTGAAVLRNLQGRFKPQDVIIDANGYWHNKGRIRDPRRILSRCDVVFNALHGTFGEDGGVQRILDDLDVPYNGARAPGSALAMDKIASKHVFEKCGLRTPTHTTLTGEDAKKPERMRAALRAFPGPFVVKPSNCGSSIGVSTGRTPSDFEAAIYKALKYSNTALIEEYIEGREATCGVIEHFRGEMLSALPPVEIVPNETGFNDYTSKYFYGTTFLCPSPNLNKKEQDAIMEAAKTAHRALGLRHYSRADFIVSPHGTYVLEVNSLPGLTERSNVIAAYNAIGGRMPELLDHLVLLALMK